MTSTLTSTAPCVDTADSTTATATMAGRTAAFLPMYRDGNDTPIAFHATITLPVSYADLVAALWVVTAGTPLDELDTDPTDRFGIPAMVMDALVNDNAGVTDALAAIDNITPGSPLAADLARVRAAVTAAFGLPQVSVR
jgi:hypothetical protein